MIRLLASTFPVTVSHDGADTPSKKAEVAKGNWSTNVAAVEQIAGLGVEVRGGKSSGSSEPEQDPEGSDNEFGQTNNFGVEGSIKVSNHEDKAEQESDNASENHEANVASFTGESSRRGSTESDNGEKGLFVQNT